MGFTKRWDVQDIQDQIHRICTEIHSPYNDGWTARGCKQELYQLKCYIEDTYQGLPEFAGEEKWEQERLVEVLKKK